MNSAATFERTSERYTLEGELTDTVEEVIRQQTELGATLRTAKTQDIYAGRFGLGSQEIENIGVDVSPSAQKLVTVSRTQATPKILGKRLRPVTREVKVTSNRKSEDGEIESSITWTWSRNKIVRFSDSRPILPKRPTTIEVIGSGTQIYEEYIADMIGVAQTALARQGETS